MNEKLAFEIEKAIAVLKKGGVILYPTDTVWGLGCDATNGKAIEKIIEIKKRLVEKSMIVLVANEKMLYQIIPTVPDMAWELMDLSEKPITIVYDEAQGIDTQLLAKDGSLAVRIPKHEFCKKLTQYFKRPIVSTSANISGSDTPLDFDHISDEIKSKVDYIVDLHQDETAKFTASSVIKISQNGVIQVIRK